MKTLSNGKLTIQVSEHGAELSSLKANDKEYLWQADPAFWKRHSPVLFPIVGGVWENVYRVDGKEYPLGQHGFARDMDFTLVAESDDKVLYELNYTEETLAKYPYKFKLYIGYALEGDKVRVIQFGTSVEFCGGCHASSTGCIGMVRILSESSVAAGVRRIEAITGKAVEEQMDRLQDTLNGLRSLFNNAPDLVGTIQKAISDNAELRKQVEEAMREKAADLKKQMLAKQKQINGFNVLTAITPLSAEYVKDIAFQLRAEVENSIVVIGSVAEGKPLLTAAASDSAVAAGVNIGKNIREAAKLMQGGGGGQPHFATAGGKNVEGIHAAVEKLIELLTA